MFETVLNKYTYEKFSSQIKQFCSKRFPQGESFLKNDSSLYLDSYSKYRTYLIINEDSNNEIVAYFTLSSASIFWNTEKEFPYPNPCVEISYFAVDDSYAKYNNKSLNTGRLIFHDFILPAVKEIANILGIEYLILFSLPIEKVIISYKKMGFTQIDSEVKEYIQYYFVKDCELMVYNLKKANS